MVVGTSSTSSMDDEDQVYYFRQKLAISDHRMELLDTAVPETATFAEVYGQEGGEDADLYYFVPGEDADSA